MLEEMLEERESLSLSAYDDWREADMIISGIQLPLSSEDELPQLLLLLATASPSANAAIMAVIFTVDKDIAEDYGNKSATITSCSDYGMLQPLL